MSLVAGIIIWIIVGGIAGWLASVVMGTRHGQTLGEDIMVGIFGGVIGGLALDLLDIGGTVSGINLVSIAVAFVGGLLLLFFLKAVRGTAQV